MKGRILYIGLILSLCACGGSKKNNPTPAPGKAVLLSPGENAVCTTGTVISDSLSSVTFTWTASDNTDSYELNLEDLLTSNSIVQTTTSTHLALTLSRGTPYSWFIISKLNGLSTTTQSATWKFYNAGPGIVTYAPFPAEITAPTLGQHINAVAGKIDLTWTGSSVDPGTIINYDVYLGTTTSPPLLDSTITNNFVNGVSVVSGTTYYWKVITRDITGDTSDSGLYQFTVN